MDQDHAPHGVAVQTIHVVDMAEYIAYGALDVRIPQCRGSWEKKLNQIADRQSLFSDLAESLFEETP